MSELLKDNIDKRQLNNSKACQSINTCGRIDSISQLMMPDQIPFRSTSNDIEPTFLQQRH